LQGQSEKPYGKSENILIDFLEILYIYTVFFSFD